MTLWLILTGTFLIEEVVSTNVVLAAAYQAGYNFWLITALFIATLCFDFFVAYRFGIWLQRHRFGKWLRRKAHVVTTHINHFAGAHGRRLTLVLVGTVSLPLLSGFIVSFLPLHPVRTFTLIGIGDMLWYAVQWSLVLGVSSLVPNPLLALFSILVLSIVVVVALRFVTRHTIGRV